MKSICCLTAVIVLGSLASVSSGQESAAALTVDITQMSGWLDNMARHAMNFTRQYDDAKQYARSGLDGIANDEPEFVAEFEAMYAELVNRGNIRMQILVRGMLLAQAHNKNALNALREANAQPNTAIGRAKASIALNKSRAEHNKAVEALGESGAALFDLTLIIQEFNDKFNFGLPGDG